MRIKQSLLFKQERQFLLPERSHFLTLNYQLPKHRRFIPLQQSDPKCPICNRRKCVCYDFDRYGRR